MLLTVLGAVRSHQAVLAPASVHRMKAPGPGEHPLCPGGICGKGSIKRESLLASVVQRLLACAYYVSVLS